MSDSKSTEDLVKQVDCIIGACKHIMYTEDDKVCLYQIDESTESKSERLMQLFDQELAKRAEEALKDFSEYAHTRYKGCTQDEYAYDSEVIVMAEDYIAALNNQSKEEK